MHKNGVFYALIYIDNHIFSCIICMLSERKLQNNKKNTLRKEVHIKDEENVSETVIEEPPIDQDVGDLGWLIASRKGVRRCRMGSKYP